MKTFSKRTSRSLFSRCFSSNVINISSVFFLLLLAVCLNVFAVCVSLIYFSKSHFLYSECNLMCVCVCQQNEASFAFDSWHLRWNIMNVICIWNEGDDICVRINLSTHGRVSVRLPYKCQWREKLSPIKYKCYAVKWYNCEPIEI